MTENEKKLEEIYKILVERNNLWKKYIKINQLRDSDKLIGICSEISDHRKKYGDDDEITKKTKDILIKINNEIKYKSKEIQLVLKTCSLNGKIEKYLNKIDKILKTPIIKYETNKNIQNKKVKSKIKTLLKKIKEYEKYINDFHNYNINKITSKIINILEKIIKVNDQTQILEDINIENELFIFVGESINKIKKELKC